MNYCKGCTVKEKMYNCSNCSYNEGFSSWGGNYPCGQQNCWYSCKVGEQKDIYTNEIYCSYCQEE